MTAQAAQTLSHFCDNPMCQLHQVMVTPGTTRISRMLPDGRDEAHNRFGYVPGDHPVFLCEVCSEAVELVKTRHTEAFEQEFVKKPGPQHIPSTVCGLPVIDASVGAGEIWTPDKKLHRA